MSDPTVAVSAPEVSSETLIALFNGLFDNGEHATRLVGGGDEPVYLPADARCPHHRIVFRADYFASALHEVAHWCIAGERRRRLVDYGYWYRPDGRSPPQQRAFERVEARPQALEWIFARAAGRRFRVSADNLDGGAFDPLPLQRAVWRAARAYCHTGLNERAERFHRALARQYGGDERLDPARFRLADLR